MEILTSMCKKNNYVLSESAKKAVENGLLDLAEHKTEHFANGRLVRNIFDTLVMNHARRIAGITNATYQQLIEVSEEDVEFPTSD